MLKTRKQKILVAIIVVLVVVVVVIAHQGSPSGPQPGSVPDEARQANRPASSFAAAEEDYFHDMDQQKDGVIALTGDEIKGRNTWIVWTGGNDRLWDKLTVDSFGALDLLKTISSYPNPVSMNPKDKLKFSRDNRWAYLGLVNEPCFEKPTGPDPDRFGLWLDKRIVSPDCPPDPFENEAEYPGAPIRPRGQGLPERKYLPKDKKMPLGSLFACATGI